MGGYASGKGWGALTISPETLESGGTSSFGPSTISATSGVRGGESAISPKGRREEWRVTHDLVLVERGNQAKLKFSHAQVIPQCFVSLSLHLEA